MAELRKCNKCLEDKPATLEYFYNERGRLKKRCKKCSNKLTVSNPNHLLNSRKSYYKNKEYYQAYRMKQYVLEKTGIALA